MFKNLKLAKKLILGFGIILMLMSISVGISLFNIGRMGKQVDQYAHYTVPNTHSIWQMRHDLVSIQRDMLTALIETDPGEIQANLDLVHTEAQQLRKKLDEYKENARVSESKLNELKGIFDEMASYREAIEALLIQGTVEANTKAYKIYKDSYMPFLDQAVAIMLEMSDEQALLAVQQETIATQAKNNAAILQIITFILSVSITIVVIIITRKAILVPLLEIEKVALAISDGNLQVNVEYQSKDELGVLADSIRRLTHTIKGIIKDVGYSLKELSDGNLVIETQAKDIYVGEFKSIQDDMEQVTSKIRETMIHINQSAQEVSSGSEDIAKTATSLAESATEQAGIIEEFIASTEEISSNIKENIAYVSQTSQVSKRTQEKALEGTVVMNRMLEAMNMISQSSSSITEVMKIIDNIASQTNLLALNAAIESARAGEAGKGFAVVANEIRDLANRSSLAVKDIESMIKESILSVEEGQEMARQTSDTLQEISKSIEETVAIAELLVSNSDGQRESIRELVEGTKQLSIIVETNSSTSQESAAISEELAAQATNLQTLIEYFKL